MKLLFYHHPYPEHGWRIRQCVNNSFQVANTVLHRSYSMCSHTRGIGSKHLLYKAAVWGECRRRLPSRNPAPTHISLSGFSPTENLPVKRKQNFGTQPHIIRPEWTRTTMKVLHHIMKALLLQPFEVWLAEPKIGSHLDAAKTGLWRHGLYYSQAVNLKARLLEKRQKGDSKIRLKLEHLSNDQHPNDVYTRKRDSFYQKYSLHNPQKCRVHPGEIW